MKADLRLIRTLSLLLGAAMIVAGCTPMTDTLPGSQTPTESVFLPGIEQAGIATSPLQPTAEVAEPPPAEPTAVVPPTELPRPAIVGPV